MIKRNAITDWMFRSLMFEAEAERFRSAGIRVGADHTNAEKSLLDEVLEPFSVDLRNEAFRMMRLYVLIYCFENSVRSLLSARLRENHVSDWWESQVSTKIQEFAESRMVEAQKNSWLEGQKQESLGFIEFGHLSDIIISNWEDFSDLIPSQHWLKQRFDELEKARNFIAHNRYLLPSEFQRVEMYVADWNRLVGL